AEWPASALLPGLAQRFGKLVYGHRVHHAAVVAGNRIEVRQAQPVLLTVVGLEAEGGDLLVVAQGVLGRPAEAAQLANRLDRLDAFGKAFAEMLATHLSAADHRLAADPAVVLEVAGDAADG